MRTTPSQLVGIQSDVRAFYFDRGIWAFGREIEDAMDRAADKATKPERKTAVRQQILNSYIAPEDTSKRFRDPSAGVKTEEAPKSLFMEQELDGAGWLA